MSIFSKFKNKFIGDRNFYRRMFYIVIPIIVQNAISNFVNLLDNIMVGQTGTDQMNGVAIVNQLLFVFNLCAWGAVSGAGIFTAQYYGKGDTEGVRNTFRAKVVLMLGVLVIGVSVFLTKGDVLVSQFLHETDEIGNAANTLSAAHSYLMVMLVGLVPFVFMQAYANTLRDIGQTLLPMKAGITAVCVNVALNYVLIFGHFGAPRLGVVGAAVATVISRFVEASILVVWTHRHTEQAAFIVGAYKTLKIPGSLMKQIVIKGTPLALNEAMWAMGITMLNQCYSTRGLAVVGATNIASTISNLFSVVYFSMGDAISIIVGQLLGAGKMKEAKDSDTKMLFFAFVGGIIVGGIMSTLRHVFPQIYKTEAEVQQLAAYFIMVISLMTPINAILHSCYFTIRTGGQTMITFLFDSFFVWVVAVPVAYFTSRYTSMSIRAIYPLVSGLDIIKCAIGLTLVVKGVWIRNIVNNDKN